MGLYSHNYVGIAGLLPEHIEDVSYYWENLIHDIEKPPPLFLGLQTSRKHLKNEQINPHYSGRMNTLEQIKEAVGIIKSKLITCSKVIVHYNPGGGYEYEETEQQTLAIKQVGVHGIQWNGFDPSMCPPPFSDMKSRGLVSILQIGPKDFEYPESFTETITHKSYQSHNTHLLFDGSGGRGIPIDTQKAVKWIKALRNSGNTLGLSISGGLSTCNVLQIKREIQEALCMLNWNISIDAEGKLFTDGKFDPEKAKRFLGTVIQFYK